MLIIMKGRYTVRNDVALLISTLLLCIAVCLVGCNRDGGVELEKYYFEMNGVIAEVGNSTDGVVDGIGECIACDESVSCVGMGIDRIYVYSGFKIFAYGDGEKFRITCIELTDINASTKRGVRIGDAESLVIEKYGNDFSKIGERIEYVGENCVLRFYLKDGIIRSIKYVSGN